MALSTKQVSEYLIEAVSPILLPLGFRLNKIKRTFKRVAGDFEHVVQFVFYTDVPGGIGVEVRVSVQSKQISAFYKRLNLEARPYTALHIDLPRLIRFYDEGITSNGDKDRYFADGDESLQALARALSTYLSIYVLRYFRDYSSLDQMERLLNSEPRALTSHNWLYPVRAQIGLILAKITKRSNLRDLLVIYAEETAGAAEPYRSEFTRVKDTIANEVV